MSRKNVTGTSANPSFIFGGSDYAMPDKENDNGDAIGSSLQDIMDSLKNPLRARVSDTNAPSDTREIDNVRYRFLNYLWQMFFGKDSYKELAKEFGLDETSNLSTTDVTTENLQTLTINGVQEVHYEERQELSFNCGGFVSTTDGRQIGFNLNVEMSSSFSAYYKQEGIPLKNMCDPLVMNFSGDISELDDTTFFFDLDADGKKEKISHLKGNSGFLALDKNNDGSINDGSELFGAKTGDGFSDLALYDSDKNGWIDENDEIFNKLKIWVKSPSGEEILYSLKDKNVGAIFLGNVNTNHTLRGDSGKALGQLRKSGFFLYEDGSGVSTISHMDMVKA